MTNSCLRQIRRATSDRQGRTEEHLDIYSAAEQGQSDHRTGVVTANVAELVDAAPVLLTEHQPRDALRLWLDRLAVYGQIKRGLAGALHTATYRQLAGEGYGPVIGAITVLLDACKEAGEVRNDIEAEEVLLLVGFLWRIETDSGWAVRTARMLDIVMGGLAATGTASA
jgi:hypothetical protein